MDRLNQFLKELSILTQKYGIEIGGCGCCGSPWLWDNNAGKESAANLEYDDVGKRYKAGKPT